MQMSSKRERVMMIAAAVVVGALVLDMFVLSPVLAWREELSQEHAALSHKLQEAQMLVDNHPQMQRRWREMVAAGLGDNAAAAEATVYRAVGEWARESGLQLQSIVPERVQEDESLQQVTLRATATGPMRAVARFLEKVEAAEFPLRVTQLQLGARREGVDDLTVQLQLSTLVRQSPQPDSPGGDRPREAAAPAGHWQENRS